MGYQLGNTIQNRFKACRGELMLKLISTEEAADMFGLRKNTLEIWRVNGKGPKFFKIGRSVKYDVGDLNMFLKQCCKDSTSEYRN